MGLFNPFVRSSKNVIKMDLVAPAPSEKQCGFAIVVIAKNEEGYISDWIKFHLLAGANKIFIYDNGSTDRTVHNALEAGGDRVVVVPWIFTATSRKPMVKFSKQVLAYCHAIENFGADFRWMAFIDVDEFLFPKTGTSILTVLENLNHLSNISVPWTMFGPSGHNSKPHVGVPFAYTMRAQDRSGALLNFKCLVNPCDVVSVHVHRFETTSMFNRTANDIGVIASNKDRIREDFVSDVNLRLNHYYTRSREELLEKINKGAVSGSDLSRRSRKIQEKLDIIDRTHVFDNSAIDFLNRCGIADSDQLKYFQFDFS